jgi:hypothetical protein
LLEAGADGDAKDQNVSVLGREWSADTVIQGDTPLDMADENGWKECAALLVDTMGVAS